MATCGTPDVSSLVSQFRKLKDLYAATKTAYDTVHFHLYRLGQWCNAARSVSFSDAKCDLHCINDAECHIDRGKARALDVKPLELGLNVLYKKGFVLLRKVFLSDSAKEDDDFDEPSKRALQTLMDFITNKQQHVQSLEKVLDGPENEVDVVDVIAQHFLGRLGPAENFFIDARSGTSHLCKCGCNAVIKTGITGIGNEEVWHGFLDLIFESHGEVLVGASVAKKARLDVEGEESVEADDVTEENLSTSPDGQNGVELIKLAENQAAAEAICFSIFQRNRHPESENFLIPFIAVSSSEVIIFMYDSVNDIFICSPKMPIFSMYQKDMNLKTMITLWLIMHYKYFCSGIPLKDMSCSLGYVKSGLLSHIEKCADKYNSMNSFIDYFRPVKEGNFFTADHERYEYASLIDISKIDAFLDLEYH